MLFWAYSIPATGLGAGEKANSAYIYREEGHVSFRSCLPINIPELLYIYYHAQ